MNDCEILKIEEDVLYREDVAVVTRPRPKKSAPAGFLLDIEQAAALPGLSAKWVYRNYKSLPHVLIGGGAKPRIRFCRAALEQYIDNHEFYFSKRGGGKK